MRKIVDIEYGGYDNSGLSSEEEDAVESFLSSHWDDEDIISITLEDGEVRSYSARRRGEKPSGCASCGGNWPECKDSCELC